MSSDAVWRKTHRLGAWVFVIGGVLFIGSAFVPAARSGVPLALIIMGLVMVPVFYLLYLWLRERTS
jgi:uncharacterized membrane protein